MILSLSNTLNDLSVTIRLIKSRKIPFKYSPSFSPPKERKDASNIRCRNEKKKKDKFEGTNGSVIERETFVRAGRKNRGIGKRTAWVRKLKEKTAG